MKPKYKWIDDLADIRLLSPDIPEIREAVVRLWKYIDSLEKSNRDWPTDLHGQYLKVLDERDALQETMEVLQDKEALSSIIKAQEEEIEELQGKLALCKKEGDILMRELSNFTNAA